MVVQFGDWQKFLDKSTSQATAFEIQEALNTAYSDSERIKVIRDLNYLEKSRWLVAYFEKCQQWKTAKNDGLASQQRTLGNACFKEKHYLAALKYYNQCVCSAVCETGQGDELSLGIANRSAVLLHLKEYEACLQDVVSALDAGYTTELRHKLLYRSALCLQKLQQSDKAVEALDKAAQMVELSTKTTGKARGIFLADVEILREKLKSQRDSTTAEVTKPMLSDMVPAHGRNALMPMASNALHMAYTEVQGRHLLANQEIKRGDVLIVERPYAAVLLPEFYPTHCYHCFIRVLAAVPCRKCVEVRFCSESCQRKSWDTYHSIECPYMDLLQSVGIAHLSLKVVLTAGLEYLIGFAAKLQSHDAGAANGLDDDGCYGNTYDAVYALLPHTRDLLRADVIHYALTAALLLKCLEPKFKAASERRDLDLVTIGGLLMRHICQLVCNAHAITVVQASPEKDDDQNSAVEEQSQVRIATAIYTTASLLNHSCRPNIHTSFQNNLLVVRAATDVPSGGEIYNCYGPHHKRMGHAERQQSLREQYFFDCKCEPCVADERMKGRISALKCLYCAEPYDRDGCRSCMQSADMAEPIRRQQEAANAFAEGLKYLQSGFVKEALPHFCTSLTIRRQVLHKHNRDLGETHDAMAKCYSTMGEYVRSAKHLTQSLSVVEAIYGDDSIEFAHELKKLTEVLMRCDKFHSRALQSADRAIRLFSTLCGEESKEVKDLNHLRFCLQLRTANLEGDR